MIDDDIKIYLPKFLSADAERKLFEELKLFPNNIDSRFYTNYLAEEKTIFQGDGVNNMLIINLPDTRTEKRSSIIISNTCDIDLNNKRSFPAQIIYSPIFNLEKYKKSLLSSGKKEQVENHISSIRKQEITQIFYLPQLRDTIDESIVFLDRLINFPNDGVSRDDIKANRLFTLSDYGSYVFLLKLSIHFTRIKDKVERRSF